MVSNTDKVPSPWYYKLLTPRPAFALFVVLGIALFITWLVLHSIQSQQVLLPTECLYPSMFKTEQEILRFGSAHIQNYRTPCLFKYTQELHNAMNFDTTLCQNANLVKNRNLLTPQDIQSMVSGNNGSYVLALGQCYETALFSYGIRDKPQIVKDKWDKCQVSAASFCSYFSMASPNVGELIKAQNISIAPLNSTFNISMLFFKPLTQHRMERVFADGSFFYFTFGYDKYIVLMYAVLFAVSYIYLIAIKASSKITILEPLLTKGCVIQSQVLHTIVTFVWTGAIISILVYVVTYNQFCIALMADMRFVSNNEKKSQFADYFHFRLYHWNLVLLIMFMILKFRKQLSLRVRAIFVVGFSLLVLVIQILLAIAFWVLPEFIVQILFPVADGVQFFLLVAIPIILAIFVTHWRVFIAMIILVVYTFGFLIILYFVFVVVFFSTSTVWQLVISNGIRIVHTIVGQLFGLLLNWNYKQDAKQKDKYNLNGFYIVSGFSASFISISSKIFLINVYTSNVTVSIFVEFAVFLSELAMFTIGYFMAMGKPWQFLKQLLCGTKEPSKPAIENAPTAPAHAAPEPMQVEDVANPNVDAPLVKLRTEIELSCIRNIVDVMAITLSPLLAVWVNQLRLVHIDLALVIAMFVLQIFFKIANIVISLQCISYKHPDLQVYNIVKMMLTQQFSVYLPFVIVAYAVCTTFISVMFFIPLPSVSLNTV